MYYVAGECRFCSKFDQNVYPADRKIADDSDEVTLGFTNKNSTTMSDLSKGPDSKADPIQMPPLSFSKVSMSSELSLNFCVKASKFSHLIIEKSAVFCISDF
jgi:hypothetical protein